MINLTPEGLTKYIILLIDEEISNVNTYLDAQKKVNSRFLECLKEFAINLDTDLNAKQFMQTSQKINAFVKMINEKSLSNISSLNGIIANLESMKKEVSIENQQCIDDINKYNKTLQKTIDRINSNNAELENFIKKNEKTDNKETKKTDSLVEEVLSLKEDNTISKKTTVIKTKQAGNLDIVKIDIIENTLIISESTGTIILPYTIIELQNILEDNKDKYNSYEEIIRDLYVKPVSYYKNFPFSRFREAYRLIRQKELGSIR